MGFTGRIEEFFVPCCQTTLNPLKRVKCSENSSSVTTQTSLIDVCMSSMEKLLSLCYYPAKDSHQSGNDPPSVVNGTFPEVVVETTNGLVTYTSASQGLKECTSMPLLISVIVKENFKKD